MNSVLMRIKRLTKWNHICRSRHMQFYYKLTSRYAYRYTNNTLTTTTHDKRTNRTHTITNLTVGFCWCRRIQTLNTTYTSTPLHFTCVHHFLFSYSFTFSNTKCFSSIYNGQKTLTTPNNFDCKKKTAQKNRTTHE